MDSHSSLESQAQRYSGQVAVTERRGRSAGRGGEGGTGAVRGGAPGLDSSVGPVPPLADAEAAITLPGGHAGLNPTSSCTTGAPLKRQSRIVGGHPLVCPSRERHPSSDVLPKTDVSDSGLGAILSQEVRGVDRPVVYISRKLSEREAGYSTVEKECLALRWEVDSLPPATLFHPLFGPRPRQWLNKGK
ncbi:uncharacterized protein AB9W97_004934 isoform 2-T2 [Spinachia spinachia]